MILKLNGSIPYFITHTWNKMLISQAIQHQIIKHFHLIFKFLSLFLIDGSLYLFVCLICLCFLIHLFVCDYLFLCYFFFGFFFAMDTIISFIFFMILISNIILHWIIGVFLRFLLFLYLFCINFPFKSVNLFYCIFFSLSMCLNGPDRLENWQWTAMYFPPDSVTSHNPDSIISPML